MHYLAVLNRDGGTLRTMDLDAFCLQMREVFERHGHSLDCQIVAGRDVAETLTAASKDSSIDAIIAGGGDGTISTAAGIAFRSGKPLAVLPVGTMNLFARALDMPLSLPEALEAIAGGKIGKVDIATANDRPFVHQFGVGIHARLVRIREGMSYTSRLGKMFASLRAITVAIVNPPKFELQSEVDGQQTSHRVSGIAVSNNRLGEGHIYAEKLDQGILGVYEAAAVDTLDLLKLAVDVLLGKWRASPMVSEREVREITLAFPKRRRGNHAVIDGELIKLEPLVRIRMHPGGVNIVVPATPTNI